MPVDHQMTRTVRNGTGIRPEHTVIGKEIGERFKLRDVIDANDIHICAIQNKTQDRPANPSEPIDRNLQCHCGILSLKALAPLSGMGRRTPRHCDGLKQPSVALK